MTEAAIRAMTIPEINRAIGKHCGIRPTLVDWWAKKDGRVVFRAMTKPEVTKWLEDQLAAGQEWAAAYKPEAFHFYREYTGCLNAMSQAEETLTAAQCRLYDRHLERESRGTILAGLQRKLRANDWIWHARRMPRAIAFLLTVHGIPVNSGSDQPPTAQ